jgi:hypothetical protein
MSGELYRKLLFKWINVQTTLRKVPTLNMRVSRATSAIVTSALWLTPDPQQVLLPATAQALVMTRLTQPPPLQSSMLQPPLSLPMLAAASVLPALLTTFSTPLRMLPGRHYCYLVATPAEKREHGRNLRPPTPFQSQRFVNLKLYRAAALATTR